MLYSVIPALLFASLNIHSLHSTTPVVASLTTSRGTCSDTCLAGTYPGTSGISLDLSLALSTSRVVPLQSGPPFACGQTYLVCLDSGNEPRQLLGSSAYTCYLQGTAFNTRFTSDNANQEATSSGRVWTYPWLSHKYICRHRWPLKFSVADRSASRISMTTAVVSQSERSQPPGLCLAFVRQSRRVASERYLLYIFSPHNCLPVYSGT